MRQSTWHAFFVRCSKSEYSMSLRFRNASSPCAHVCALHYRRRTAPWHTCSGVLEYRVMANCMHTMPHKHTYALTLIITYGMSSLCTYTCTRRPAGMSIGCSRATSKELFVWLQPPPLRSRFPLRAQGKLVMYATLGMGFGLV